MGNWLVGPADRLREQNSCSCSIRTYMQLKCRRLGILVQPEGSRGATCCVCRHLSFVSPARKDGGAPNAACSGGSTGPVGRGCRTGRPPGWLAGRPGATLVMSPAHDCQLGTHDTLRWQWAGEMLRVTAASLSNHTFVFESGCEALHCVAGQREPELASYETCCAPRDLSLSLSRSVRALSPDLCFSLCVCLSVYVRGLRWSDTRNAHSAAANLSSTVLARSQQLYAFEPNSSPVKHGQESGPGSSNGAAALEIDFPLALPAGLSTPLSPRAGPVLMLLARSSAKESLSFATQFTAIR